MYEMVMTNIVLAEMTPGVKMPSAHVWTEVGSSAWTTISGSVDRSRDPNMARLFPILPPKS